MDVLVAAHGVLDNQLLDQSDPVAWWRSLDVNLKGSYACVRACLRSMLARQAGTVICMSSAPFTRGYN